jgi:hypothetical protein
MSNCANIINRLTRELCNLQIELAKFDCMRGVLELNQDIYQHLSEIAYLVPDDSTHSSHCGIPVTVRKTYDGSVTTSAFLLVAKTTDGKAILVNTSNLHNYTERQCTGLVCFTNTLPVCVEKVNVKVLDTLDSAAVSKILQECASTTCCGTITLEEYNLLLAFLYPYGVRTIGIHQAACFYKSAMRLHNNDNNDIDHNDQNYPYEPNEPYEPGEPSEIPITLDIKYVYNENNYSGLNNSLKNESIENKLKALLEATDTETTS